MIAHPGPWTEDSVGDIIDANGEVALFGDNEGECNVFPDDYAKALVMEAPSMLALLDRVQAALAYQFEWSTQMKIRFAIELLVRAAKSGAPMGVRPWEASAALLQLKEQEQPKEPDMDAEGWRKKYEAAANEASILRLQCARAR
jgi:hypothetical protein